VEENILEENRKDEKNNIRPEPDNNTNNKRTQEEIRGGREKVPDEYVTLDRRQRSVRSHRQYK